MSDLTSDLTEDELKYFIDVAATTNHGCSSRVLKKLVAEVCRHRKEEKVVAVALVETVYGHKLDPNQDCPENTLAREIRDDPYIGVAKALALYVEKRALPAPAGAGMTDEEWDTYIKTGVRPTRIAQCCHGTAGCTSQGDKHWCMPIDVPVRPKIDLSDSVELQEQPATASTQPDKAPQGGGFGVWAMRDGYAGAWVCAGMSQRWSASSGPGRAAQSQEKAALREEPRAVLEVREAVGLLLELLLAKGVL